METISSSPFSFRQISSALLIGSVALLILGLQPILLGELVEKHFITMEGVGIVAMGEIVALGLGVVLGDVLVILSRYRLITVLPMLVVAGVDLATCYASGDVELTVLRAFAGLAEGILVGVATNVIVRANKPDRLAAVYFVAQAVMQICVSALLATYVMPQSGLMGGWHGGFRLLGLASLLSVPLILWLPSRLAPLESPTDSKFHWSTVGVLSLLIAFLQMAAIGSLWAYLEPLGLHIGLDAEGSQNMASKVLFMQIVGGITAIWMVRRLGIVAVVGLGAMVLVGIAGGIHCLPSGATAMFALLCAVFGFFWALLMPFHIGLALRADTKGHVAILVPAVQLLGLAFGPLIASFLVSGDDAGPVPIVSLCFAGVTMALVLFGRKLWTKYAPMPTEAYTDKVVLVAGASSGMGRAFALRLADEGAHIVVTARRKERLDTLAAEIERRGGRCLALAADAEDPVAASAVVAACIEKFGRIDLAFLNVGGAPALDMRKMSARDVTSYMRTNYDTVVNYLFPVLDQMRKQHSGTVAHTNSLAGFLGVPLQGPYSAAKGALRLLFDTCRIEFAPYGIRFVSIYPGFVATEKTANNGLPAPLEISEDEAVDHILLALRQQRSDYLFPWSMRLLVKLAGVLPKPLTNWILSLEVPLLPEQHR